MVKNRFLVFRFSDFPNSFTLKSAQRHTRGEKMSATVVPIDDSVEEEKKQDEMESEKEVLFSQDGAKKKKRRMRESRMLREQRTMRVKSIYEDFNPRTTKRVFLQRLKSLAVRKEQNEWIIFKPSNPWRISWDGLIILCLLYVFIVTPLEVTYNEPSSNGWTTWN